MIKDTDYAYAAGFIDGEGSFSLRVYNRNFKQFAKKQGKIKTYRRKMVQPVVAISILNKTL